MIVREILNKEKINYNQLVNHPLQSWEWGDFRQRTGVETVRLGEFEKNRLIKAYQLTIHPLPLAKLNLKLIYFPKGPRPDKTMLAALTDLGKDKNAVFIRMEPDISETAASKPDFEKLKKFLLENGCRTGRPLFTPYTFQIDLSKTNEQLLGEMKEKTRYNLKLAQKYGVTVEENNSPAAFETYLKLTSETTQRQGFFSHTLDYHRKMWSILQPAGIAHLMLARYKKEILVAWMLFKFKNRLFYPYGASSRQHRYVMAGYQMMWETIKYGRKEGCKIFDLWGSLGPNPDPKDPWFGFHRFKEGFGPQLVEFIGTYDLVIDYRLYPLVRKAEDWRQKLLHFRSRLPL